MIEQGWVKVGEGSDAAEASWSHGFDLIGEIDLEILNFESAGVELSWDKVFEIARREGMVTTALSGVQYDRAVDLLSHYEDFNKESTFYETDMPYSSIGYIYTAKESGIIYLVACLDHIRNALIELSDEIEVYEQLDAIEQETENRKKLEDIEKLKQQADDEEEIQRVNRKKAFNLSKEILAFLNSPQCRFYHSSNILVDSKFRVIWVSLRHVSYRQKDPVIEQTASFLEDAGVKVYRVEEHSPPGAAHIPHFAGSMRRHVMGWKQETSQLAAEDPDLAKQATEVRHDFITSLSETKTGH